MRRMIEEKYTPHAIESKWQKYWEDNKAFKTDIDAGKPKSYVLEMFPYPSGNLHMGHVRNYSIGDVVARFRSMNGFNVLHPMGWDSFGMPAENAAIKHGIHPAKWTMENIANMTRQQKELGLSYDWDREVATCKEDYYKWTQWFFELFYKRGLAVKKNLLSTGVVNATLFWLMSRLSTDAAGAVTMRSLKRSGTMVLQNYRLCWKNFWMI